MKNAYIFIFLIIFLMSCKSKKNDYVEIKRSQINYRIFFEDNMKDSIALHFPYAYIIKNNSNDKINFKFIKSKPESFLTGDFTINKNGELAPLLNEKIVSGDSLHVIFFVSKVYSKKEMQQYLPFENFKNYKVNIKKNDESKQQVLLNHSVKKYLEEIEKDSIFFEFMGEDRSLWFLKCGTIKGKTFFTDDKSNK